jgi:adenylylsulfate kinase-like enzyme
MAGEIDSFTGISSPYEAPENAELVVETDIHTVDEIVAQIINELKIRGILPMEK